MNTFKRGNFPVPVDIFLRLFNGLPQQSSVRGEVLDFLKTYKNTFNPKEHTVEGFRLNEDNELVFDEGLYTEAVYRGKIETRTRTAKEQVERLRSELEMLKSMGESHAIVAGSLSPSAIQQRVGDGIPISEEQATLLSKLLPLLLSDGKENEA
jgi:hypothetical protein